MKSDASPAQPARASVLAHRVSITMDTDFCVLTVEEALAKCGPREIFNTVQGSRFTSQELTELFRTRGACWRDH